MLESGFLITSNCFKFPQKIDYSLLEDDEDGKKSSDSEPEMFDNVMETSSRPQVIDSESDSATDSTPIKKPPPKRQLGPKPVTTKRKIVSSDSENSPVKKKVSH